MVIYDYPSPPDSHRPIQLSRDEILKCKEHLLSKKNWGRKKFGKEKNKVFREGCRDQNVFRYPGQSTEGVCGKKRKWKEKT